MLTSSFDQLHLSIVVVDVGSLIGHSKNKTPKPTCSCKREPTRHTDFDLGTFGSVCFALCTISTFISNLITSLFQQSSTNLFCTCKCPQTRVEQSTVCRKQTNQIIDRTFTQTGHFIKSLMHNVQCVFARPISVYRFGMTI